MSAAKGMRRRTHNTLAALKVTGREGADNWLTLMVHAVEMPDGRQWDAINGWRGPDIEIAEREEHIAILEAEIAKLNTRVSDLQYGGRAINAANPLYLNKLQNSQ